MRKRMYKKGLVVGIILLFISVVSASNINNNIIESSGDCDYVKITTQNRESEIINRESSEVTTLDGTVEVIDQHQIEDCGWTSRFYPPKWKAQSFTPTLETLTKIKVRIEKDSNIPGDKNVTIHIRASLTGEDLVNLSKIPDLPWGWVEYDFPDIKLIPGNKYYIICESKGGIYGKSYSWHYQINDGYKGGEAWVSIDSGETWTIEEYPPYQYDFDFCFITYGLDEPPNIPIIDGPITGKPGTPYTYTFTSIDSDGDNISYYIDWGDGNITNWTAYQVSGIEYSESHNWSEKGTYTIEAKAKDIHGVESDWGKLIVTMPRDKSTNNVLLLKLLERFPLLQKLLFSL